MSVQANEAFERLVTIMDELREKCPWDRKQTIQSLRQLTIEETYELADAITDNDWKGIKEELGDILLHIVFYAKIGSEQNQFTLDEMINHVCDKLVARHPHIYGDVKVNDEEDVKKNWEKLKLKEGRTSVLGGVPLSLPAMVKAMRPGSVIVDIAVEQGGNCALTDQGRVVTKHGVHIVGLPNLPSLISHTSSSLYANNLYQFVLGAWDAKANKWRFERPYTME